MSEKIPYIPNQEKRFAISPDSFSQERLVLLREVKQAVENELGFTLYLSLFGSLSKGKTLDVETAPQSDIDLRIYIDSDDLAAHHEQSLQNSWYARLYAGALQTLPPDDNNRQQRAQRLAVEQYIHWYIANQSIDRITKLGFSDSSLEETIKHIQVELISPQTIIEAWRTVRAVKADAGADSANQSSGSRQELARFFHLNIGGGLNKYIRHFFMVDSASLTPTEKEECWQDIRQAIEDSERDGVIPQNMRGQLTETFDQAYGYFVNRNRQQSVDS